MADDKARNLDVTSLRKTEPGEAFLFGLEVASSILDKPLPLMAPFNAMRMLFEIANGDAILVDAPADFRAKYVEYESQRDPSTEDADLRQFAANLKACADDADAVARNSIQRDKEKARKILGPLFPPKPPDASPPAP